MIASGCVVALALAVSYGWFCHHVEAAWQAMIADADRMQTRLEAIDPERPVLWGETIEGNGWDDYRRAIALVSDAPDARERWEACRRAEIQGDAAVVQQLRQALAEDFASVFAALRAGTHRRKGWRPVDWNASFEHNTASLLRSRTLVNLTVMEAQRQAIAGEATGAVHTLLDALQFGRDTMCSPVLINEMIGLALVAIASKETVLDFGLLDRLPPAALRELQAGLRILDQGLPTRTDVYHSEVVLLVRGVIDAWAQSAEPNELAEYRDGPASWRYGFSGRLMCTDYVQEIGTALERLANSTEPWQVRRAYLEQLQESFAQSANPLSNFWSTVLITAERSRRDALVCLRLTRMAVAYRLDGAVPVLPDPYGDRLGFELDSAGLSMWSVGADGVIPPDASGPGTRLRARIALSSNAMPSGR